MAAGIARTVAPAQDFVIRGATVHTASAKGTLKDTDVVVRGGVIVAIGAGSSLHPVRQSSMLGARS